MFCGPALRGWLPFTPIESTSPISLSLSLSLSLSHSLSLDSPSNTTMANNRPSSSLFSSISLCNVEREESRFGGGALSRCRFRPYARLSRTLHDFSLSLSLSLSSSLSGRATYRADPLFLRATRVCYTMPLQVENTDRLGINRSRDTEEQGEGAEGGRKKEEARG